MLEFELRRFNRRAEPAAREKQTPVDPTQWFDLRRFNRRYTPDDPAKSNLNAGAVVQRDYKMS